MNRQQRRERRAKQLRKFPHITIGTDVAYVTKKAGGGSEIVLLAVEAFCSNCGCAAIVKLPERLRDAQCAIDGTTHVCLPAIGGCNMGFAYEGAPEAAQKEENDDGSQSL